MKKSILIATMFTLCVGSLLAQSFNVTGEFRPRFESRNGYKTLRGKDTKAANFVSQRTRLNFKYNNQKLHTYVSLQNVRVWGDVSTLSKGDRAIAFHEAWAQYSLTDKVALKMGRQEIVYDDSRIFGNVGWAQQARSHDALLVKFSPSAKHRLDIGLALNSDGESLSRKQYTGVAGYKNFQYGWYHGKFGKLGLSLLALNTGVEYAGNNDLKIDYMQTVGPRLTFKLGNISANAAAYVQTGKLKGNDVNASYYAVNVAFKALSSFKLGAGVEVLSGKDQNDTDKGIKSFAPLFGTNHKFNGWMDYFYVGNHGGSVGLIDINFPLIYSKDRLSVKIIPHLFSSEADIYNGTVKMDRNLGTEVDLALGYKLSSSVSFSAGYSQMFATESLEVLKGGDKDANNSWAWVMFTFKPLLFSSVK